MCGVRHRVVALLAMQTHLENTVRSLRASGSGSRELGQRMEELELVNDELAAVMSDPAAAELVAALR